jgi:hypothetical protein
MPQYIITECSALFITFQLSWVSQGHALDCHAWQACFIPIINTYSSHTTLHLTLAQVAGILNCANALMLHFFLHTYSPKEVEAVHEVDVKSGHGH